MYEKYIKRIFDLVVSTAAIIILSPVLAVLAVMVRFKLGTPVLFKQKRPGLKGKIFTLYKFRTMTDEKDKNGNLLSDEIRLTKFGQLLRAMSLDELPELFNILKGDMSLVGPRPLLIQYLPLYDENQSRRHDVRPGLTGLAQISGRNAVSWEERFLFDVTYVDNVSFLSDIKIIMTTVVKVFKKEGISSKTAVTMEPFTGNLEKKRA